MQISFLGAYLTIQAMTAHNVTDLPTFNISKATNISSLDYLLAPSAITPAPNASRVSALFTIYQDNRLFPSSTSTDIATPVVDVTLAEASLSGELQFSYVPALFSKCAAYQCVYWDSTHSVWATSGVTTSTTGPPYMCTSSHLTNFAMLVVCCCFVRCLFFLFVFVFLQIHFPRRHAFKYIHMHRR